MPIKNAGRWLGQNLFEQQVFSQLDILLPQKEKTRIAVGVSGGADSVALALLLQAYLKAKPARGTLTAFTVDHGLRPESGTEAFFVAQILSPLGIRHKIITWSGEKPTTALQEKARFARHRLLREACRKEGFETLLLAHHHDDQEETLLMRYLRQSRLAGLSGMSAVSTSFDWPEGKVIRPLLIFPKEHLVAYLNEKKVRWIEDPSNKNLIFERVRLRQALTKTRPWILDHLSTFGRLRASYEKVLNHLVQECVTLFPEGYAEIEGASWERIPSVFQQDLFERVIMTVGGHLYPPRRKNLDLFCNRLRSHQKGRLSFGGCLISKTKAGLRIIRELSAVSRPYLIQDAINQRGSLLWDHRFRWTKKNTELIHERLLNGVTIESLGHQDVLHLKKENKLDRYKDFPSSLLQTFPVFRQGGKTLCIPMLGYISHPKWSFLVNSLTFDPPQPLYREFVAL